MKDVLNRTLSDILSVLNVIKNGIDEEMSQIKTLNLLIRSQSEIIGSLTKQEVVSMEEISRAQMEYDTYYATCQKHIDTVKNLQSYLSDRIQAANDLKKKLETLESECQVIDIRGQK
jgi:phosphopantothenate synthetase